MSLISTGTPNSYGFSLGFFYGVDQEDPPPMGGAGGILHLANTHSIDFSAGLGSATNNFSELVALKLLLQLAWEKYISQPHIYGDSQLVIHWMKGDFLMQNYAFSPLFQSLKSSSQNFSQLTFDHVYRHWNQEVDSLSKADLDLDKCTWKSLRRAHLIHKIILWLMALSSLSLLAFTLSLLSLWQRYLPYRSCLSYSSYT